jgi:FMN reductase
MLTGEAECGGPLFVGLGGTLRSNSSSERAVRHCLAAVERHGGRTKLYCGEDIHLPMYNPHEPARTREAIQLRRAVDHRHIALSVPERAAGVGRIVGSCDDYQTRRLA